MDLTDEQERLLTAIYILSDGHEGVSVDRYVAFALAAGKTLSQLKTMAMPIVSKRIAERRSANA